MSYRVVFDKYTNIISHGEQNVTMTFNVSGQGHSAKELKLRYLANCWFYGVLFDMYTHIIYPGEQTVPRSEVKVIEQML